MTHPLSNADDFNRFSLLHLNKQGNYIQPDQDLENFSDAQDIQLNQLPEFFERKIVLRPEVTDVFVWVHGWRNTAQDALASSRRLFNGIQEGWNQRETSYPSPVKVKLIKPESHAQASLMDNENFKVGCTII